MKAKILYILFVFFSSCGIKSVTYKKARSLELKKGYETLLNGDANIEIQKYYLDTENIENIKADKKSKTLNIFQKNKKPEYFNLTEVELDKFKKRYDIDEKDSLGMILIDGVLIDKKDYNEYNVEYSVVEEVKVLQDVDGTKINCSGSALINILLIRTKYE